MAGADDENPPLPIVTLTQQAPHNVSAIKLPILKKGEYDIWAMEMEHYLAHTDNPIWEVIQRGNGPVSVSTDTNGQIKVLPPKTPKEILARERERKARTTLLMAIPEDHLAKFHKMTDAKEMWEAIKSRFGGNNESKKMHKYILKQQFQGFSVSNSKGLHKGYDRFQSLQSQLEIHGAGVSTKDANQKFLRSLPSSWSQVSLIMRTKPGVDSLSFDNLYNNLRVFKTDVKALLDHLLVYIMLLLFLLKALAALMISKENQDIKRRDVGNTGYKAKDNGRIPGKQEEPKALPFRASTLDELKDAPECMKDFIKLRNACSSHPPMIGKLQCLLNLNLELDDHKTLESVPEPVVIKPKVVSQPKVWSDAPMIEEYESNSDDEYSPKVDKRDWNGLMSKKLGLGYGFTRKACFICDSFGHLIRDYDFHEKKMAKQVELNKKKSNGIGQGENRPVWNNVQRLNHQNKFVPTAVLIRTGRFPVNTARHNFNSQVVSTSAARKANVIRPIVNDDDPQKTLKGKGIVDSGCSRHMTGNKAYLVEYQEFQGGSVVFGDFNLFSVSQMCDKKNKVLFTNTECLVLSPDFKLPDENQVLLRIPRQNNMYSFNLENIVPTGGLDCLIAKATVDESNKWHRRYKVSTAKPKLSTARKTLVLLNGIDCLTNQEIYENLHLMGYEGDLTILTFQKALFSLQWRNLDAKKKSLMYLRFVQVFLNNQLSTLPAPLDNLPIPVLTKKVFTNMAKQGLHFSGHATHLLPNMLAQAVVDEGEGSEQPTEPQPTPSPTQPSIGDQPLVIESSSRYDTTQVPRDSLEGTDGSKGDQVQLSNDRPHSGGNTSERAEDGLNLQVLHNTCTLLSQRVYLQKAKDAQAVKIFKLKKRIKKLEKKCKPSISHHKAWLKSLQRLSMKKRLGKKESVSKQGRKNAKSKPTLDAFDDLDADLAHGMDYMEIEESVNEGRQSNETEKLNLDVDTEGIAEDKGSGEKGVAQLVLLGQKLILLGQMLMLLGKKLMKEEKAKEKGVAFKDVEDSSRLARSVLTLKLLPSIDPKDKGNGIDADALFAAKLQQEEREEYTIKERAKFLAETIAAQRKFRAAQRAAKIRNDAVKDSKKAAGKDTSKEKEVLKELDSTRVEVKLEAAKQGTKKTPGKTVKMKAKKKGRKQTHANIDVEHDSKEDERKTESINKIFRSDGSSRWIKTFSEMVTRFDRLDLVELYNLVMPRFKTTTPECVDLVLWGDLRTMVHTLTLEDGTNIHMLAERRYPLTKETLKRMMSLKLLAESASDGAYNLLRFIQKHIDETGSYNGGEMIFKCWFHHHATNGHQFTMSNKHQEPASPEQSASDKDFSNSLMVDSLPKTIWLVQSKQLLVKTSQIR
ncbi:hypothetical protein Tco_0647460 [Tanacetum coccineum]